jgi:hypothetical protein
VITDCEVQCKTEEILKTIAVIFYLNSMAGKTPSIEIGNNTRELKYIRNGETVMLSNRYGQSIAGEAPTMRKDTPSKLAQKLTMDGVFFRGFWIKDARC